VGVVAYMRAWTSGVTCCDVLHACPASPLDPSLAIASAVTSPSPTHTPIAPHQTRLIASTSRPTTRDKVRGGQPRTFPALRFLVSCVPSPFLLLEPFECLRKCTKVEKVFIWCPHQGGCEFEVRQVQDPPATAPPPLFPLLGRSSTCLPITHPSHELLSV